MTTKKMFCAKLLANNGLGATRKENEGAINDFIHTGSLKDSNTPGILSLFLASKQGYLNQTS
jgi:hypothetical protein